MVEFGRLVQPLTVILPSGDRPVAKLGGGATTVFVPREPAMLAGGVPLALGSVEAEVQVVDGVGEGDALNALEIMELAMLGEMIVVVALTDAELLLEPVRIILPRTSAWVSMKAIVGPATNWEVACWTTLAASGCESEVINIATGPFMPCGTMHWLNGKAIEKGKPPASIWQNIWLVIVPSMAADWKLNVVPGCIEPVFVTVNDGLAEMPRLHSETKGPAMART